MGILEIPSATQRKGLSEQVFSERSIILEIVGIPEMQEMFVERPHSVERQGESDHVLEIVVFLEILSVKRPLL